MPLDIGSIDHYELQVIAVCGRPIGQEKSRVDRIEHWSLNRLGQIAFLAQKDSRTAFAQDLYLASDGQTTCLLTQRSNQPLGPRRARSMEGLLLANDGRLYMQGFADEKSRSHLWLIKDDDLQPMPNTDLEVSSFQLSGDGKLAFLSFDRNRLLAEIRAGAPDGTVGVLKSGQDPSDPLARFSGFEKLWAINNRGQILFEASVGRDSYRGQRLFLYSPSPPGVREIARHGGRLPGTSITLADNSGHDVWHDAKLSDQGDVVMIAETNRRLPDGQDDETLFVLRDGSETWHMSVAHGQPVGKLPLEAYGVSHPGMNSRGQFAAIVDIRPDPNDYQTFQQRLIRFEPDGTAVELAQTGQKMDSGHVLGGLCGSQSPCPPPLVFPRGQVVCQASLKGEDSSEVGVVVADEREVHIAVRFPTDLPADIRGVFSWIDAMQVNERGQIGILVKDGSHRPTLLLAIPRYKKAGDSPGKGDEP